MTSASRYLKQKAADARNLWQLKHDVKVLTAHLKVKDATLALAHDVLRLTYSGRPLPAEAVSVFIQWVADDFPASAEGGLYGPAETMVRLMVVHAKMTQFAVDPTQVSRAE